MISFRLQKYYKYLIYANFSLKKYQKSVNFCMANLTKLAKLTKFCQRISGQDILLPVGQVCQLCHAIFCMAISPLARVVVRTRVGDKLMISWKFVGCFPNRYLISTSQLRVNPRP